MAGRDLPEAAFEAAAAAGGCNHSSCVSKSPEAVTCHQQSEKRRATRDVAAWGEEWDKGATTVERMATSLGNVPTRLRSKPKEAPSIDDGCKSKWPCFDDGTPLSPQSKLGIWLNENFGTLEKSDIKGRLAKHFEAWRKVCSDAEILGAIKNGYSPLLQNAVAG